MGSAVDHFNPAKVPGAGCTGARDESYKLTKGSKGDVGIISLSKQAIPAQIAVDPNGSDIWITCFWSDDVVEVNLKTDLVVTTVSWANENPYSSVGSAPWQAIADSGYVYVINYASDTLVQINKATHQVNQIQIPVTSADEEGYGLALSGSHLFFTLADDYRTNFAADSTFGYVDISSWETESPQCAPSGRCTPVAVVYTGLDYAVDPSSNGQGPQSDFRGMAVDSQGAVAIADNGLVAENGVVTNDRQVLGLEPLGDDPVQSASSRRDRHGVTE